MIAPAFRYATAFANGRAFIEREENQFAVIDKSGNVVAAYEGLGFTTLVGRRGYELVTSFNKGTGIAAMTAGSKQVSFIRSDGQVLLTVERIGATVYISDKYVFVGDRMFEIVRQ